MSKSESTVARFPGVSHANRFQVRVFGVGIACACVLACTDQSDAGDEKSLSDNDVHTEVSGALEDDSAGSDAGGTSDDADGKEVGPSTTDVADDSKDSSSPAECQSDKQCVEFDQVCNTVAHLCVECLSDADCDSPAGCKGFQCWSPPDPCSSSKECGTGLVCHKEFGFCVECGDNADCGTGTECFETVCIDPKLAGKQCTPGATKCASNSTLAVCKADGSAFETSPCKANEVCIDGACQPQVCSPGKTSCDGSKVQLCSDDGLSFSTLEDCATGDKPTCVAGVCVGDACQNGNTICKSSSVLLTCSGGAWVESACGAGESCDSGACTKPSCAPGSKTCIGNEVAVCDASGTGWAPSEDCDTAGKLCQSGTCVDKQSGFKSEGGFGTASVPSTGQAFLVVQQGFALGRSCSKEYCQIGGFR